MTDATTRNTTDAAADDDTFRLASCSRRSCLACVAVTALLAVAGGAYYFIGKDTDDDNPPYQYGFNGGDVGGVTPGNGTSDALIRVDMYQGSDINWDNVVVKVAIDGAAPVICDNPGVEGTAPCKLEEYGYDADNDWSAGDGFTVVENGQDLCSGPCTIDVTIEHTREGILGTVSVTAE
tara:strand:- start:2980 stop:3516 length:537 start_codon:yes stop_codon:yes gene_type:complete